MSRLVPGAAPAAVDAADCVVLVDPRTGRPMWPYASPDGRSVNVASTMGVLFSDDFGGSAIDPARWTVLDGGQGAVTLASGAQQAAIGSGVTLAGNGGSVSVSGSALTIAMPAANNIEYWLMSNAVFAGSEDLLVILTKSAASANNSLFIGLVEVDSSGNALLNPNLAGDFTNRGGVEFARTASATAYQCEAVADSSGVAATGTAGVAAQSFVTGNEVVIEFEAMDIIASTVAPDSIGGRVSTPARVASQCPNDGKQYRLLIRARNLAATAVTYVIQRILMKDGQEFRVEVSSGRGDFIGQKAAAVNIAGGVTGASALSAQGAFADNTAGNPNPLLVSAVMAASAGGPAAGTAGNQGRLQSDVSKRLIVKPAGNPQSHNFNRTALANTTETTLVAAVAAIRHEVQSLTCANRDTVAHTFDFRDTTGGTIRLSVTAPAGDTRHVDFPSGYPAAALNTNWTVQLREAVTTTSPEVSSSSYQTTA